MLLRSMPICLPHRPENNLHTRTRPYLLRVLRSSPIWSTQALGVLLCVLSPLGASPREVRAGSVITFLDIDEPNSSQPPHTTQDGWPDDKTEIIGQGTEIMEVVLSSFVGKPPDAFYARGFQLN